MKNKLENHRLHSGGAYGADAAFAWYGIRYGIPPKHQHHYRPDNNVNLPKQLRDIGIVPHVLTSTEMEECYKFMFECLEGKKIKSFKRNFANDLKARNYYQVKNSQAIYAVAELTPDFTNVHGGTKYAVTYAKRLQKLIYVFDYTKEAWYVWVNDKEGFCILEDKTPILFENFAGIGSRKIQQYKVKDKNTGEWVDNPDYIGNTLKNVCLEAIDGLYKKECSRLK